MSGIKDYSLTPASNMSINSIDISEGCPPSSINNAIRQEMADTRSFYESGGFVAWGHTCTYASATTFTVSGDVTAVYVANRRIRAVGTATGTIYGKVASSSYSAPNTTVTVTWDSGSLSNEALTVSVGWVAPTGSPVYVPSGISGPGSSTSGYIPQWSGTGGAALSTGLAVGTAANNLVQLDGTAKLPAVDGSLLTNLPASASPAFKNLIIGGDFTTNPWQRGTSFTSPANGSYVADRFVASTTGSGVFDVLKTADAPTASQAGMYTQHCLHMDVTTADASIGATDFYAVQQRIEGLNAGHLGFGRVGAQSVMLSFWHKHTKTGTHSVAILNSAEDRSYVAEYAQAVADTWEKATITIAGDTSGTWLNTTGIGLYVFFPLAMGSNYTAAAGAWSASGKYASANQVNNLDNVANNFKIALVQLEAGASATTFEALPVDVVLARCQRYAIVANSAASSAHWLALGAVTTSSRLDGGVAFPTKMRATPTLTSAGTWFAYTGAAGSQTVASFGFGSASGDGGQLQCTVSGTPFAVGDAGQVFGSTTSDRLTFSAEL
jgi:hypothetical protein